MVRFKERHVLLQCPILFRLQAPRYCFNRSALLPSKSINTLLLLLLRRISLYLFFCRDFFICFLYLNVFPPLPTKPTIAILTSSPGLSYNEPEGGMTDAFFDWRLRLPSPQSYQGGKYFLVQEKSSAG